MGRGRGKEGWREIGWENEREGRRVVRGRKDDEMGRARGKEGRARVRRGGLVLMSYPT